MKKLAAILVCLFMAGCQTCPTKLDDQPIIVKDKMVIPQFSDEMTKLPDQVAPIDVAKATQKDAADWIIRNEERMTVLENMITSLKNSSSDLVNKLKLKDGDYVIVDLSKKVEEKK
jgi:hypothetical protein